jgi:hypothetical protein
MPSRVHFDFGDGGELARQAFARRLDGFGRLNPTAFNCQRR